MTGLLVSVRSVDEALAALEGGATIIDVKEPAHGPLGKADDDVIRAIIDAVAGRAPVSAAMGEWGGEMIAVPARLTFIKWGLSGVADPAMALELIRRECPPDVMPVAVAYADMPEPVRQAIIDAAIRHQFPIFLIDTFQKDGRTLLDHLDLATLEPLIRKLHAHEIRIALAGSLGLPEIKSLLPLNPDWIAVRGAACESGNRRGVVSRERVGEIRSKIEKSREGIRS